MSRKLVIAAPHHIALEKYDPGPLQARQVLARTVVSGISHGTEMTAFMGTSPFIEKSFTPERCFRPSGANDPPFYPFYWPGYDLIGIVEAVGDEVRDFAPGDRVWCGLPHQSAFVFEEDNREVLHLEAATDEETPIFTNLASVALCAIHDAQIKLGDVVAVFGGGIVGQLAVQMAFLSGARRVFLVEPLAGRRALATAKTAVTTIDPTQDEPIRVVLDGNEGQPPDVVIECSGTVRGLQAALRTAGVAGTVIAAGFYAGNAAALSLGEEFLHNRVTLKASMSVWGCPSRAAERWDRRRLLQQALHLLATGRLDVADFISARFPFDKAQAAYEAIRDAPNEHLKLALTYGEEEKQEGD